MIEHSDEERVVVIVNELGVLIQDEGMTPRRIEEFAPMIMWALNVTNGHDARCAIVGIVDAFVDDGRTAALRAALGIDNSERRTLQGRWKVHATDHEFGGTPTKVEFCDRVSKAVELLALRLSTKARLRDSSQAEALSDLSERITRLLQ